MGAGHSREGKLDDSESEEEEEEEEESPSPAASSKSNSQSFASASSKDGLQSIDVKLDFLSLGGKRGAHGPQKAKLYRYLGGNTPKAQWVVAEKAASWEFVRDGDDDEEGKGDDDDDDGGASWKTWFLLVGNKVRARVGEKMQAKFFGDQLRVDFVHYGVWALKFPSPADYTDFDTEFRNCLFENTFMLEATEENKIKVFGKDFMGWAKPEEADDTVWEDAEESFEIPRGSKPLREDYVEPSKGGIQSLTMGALDHSFLVSAKGIEAVRNLPSGIQGKGISVAFGGADTTSSTTPKKAMLIKGESNLMVLSPSNQATPHSSGVHQLDVGTGKVVAEWKFEKDGTPISMRDVTTPMEIDWKIASPSQRPLCCALPPLPIIPKLPLKELDRCLGTLTHLHSLLDNALDYCKRSFLCSFHEALVNNPHLSRLLPPQLLPSRPPQVRYDTRRHHALAAYNFAAVLPGDSVAALVLSNGVLNFLNIYNTLLVVRLILTWFPEPPQVIVNPLRRIISPL